MVHRRHSAALFLVKPASTTPETTPRKAFVNHARPSFPGDSLWGASMRDAKASFRAAAARLDTFLLRATADFGGNETDRAQTERRVDEHLRRQDRREPLPPGSQA